MTGLAAALAAAALATAAPARSPAAAVAPDVARPGDAVLVRLPGAGEDLEATLAGRPLQFFPKRGERWAVAALPLEVPPGPVPLEIAGAAGPAATLEVVDPRFPSRALQVSPRFVEPPASVQKRIARDRRAFAAAYARPFAPPLFRGNFEWPRRDRTTGHFGDQRVFNGKVESVHYGLDITGAPGAPVHASNDGEVVLARDCYYSGKTVVIWHGADLFTLYFHLDRMLVRPGAKVKKGQRIGAVGTTGRSTGPHLHWSARAAGLLVDPESLVAIDFSTGAASRRYARPPAEAPRDEPAPPAAPPEAAPAAPPQSELLPAGVAPGPATAAPDAEAAVSAPSR
jgi:murein DD-endopeptidase MepM/ murein hydrolase activator NlpD